MSRLLFLMICLCLLGSISLSAQEDLSPAEKQRRQDNIEAANPFKQFGYKAKIATLSKGKYLEVHDLDSIVTIGSIRFHVEKMKIVGIVVADSTDREFARPIGDMASRWLSPDPLTEEYPDWTPYRFGFNNPIRYNDPTGLLETDFGVNDKGEVTQIGPTDNNPDRLFKLNNDGSVDKNVAPITVNDKELLPQLTPESAKIETMANGEDSTKDVTVNIATTDVKNKNDAFNVFKFMADNTSVEWSLGKINYQGLGTNYQLGTFHENDLSPGVRNSEIGTVLGLIHSHPSPKSVAQKNEGLFGDRYVGRQFLNRNGRNIPYLIYFPFDKSTTRIGLPKNSNSNEVTIDHNEVI